MCCERARDEIVIIVVIIVGRQREYERNARVITRRSGDRGAYTSRARTHQMCIIRAHFTHTAPVVRRRSVVTVRTVFYRVCNTRMMRC